GGGARLAEAGGAVFGGPVSPLLALVLLLLPQHAPELTERAAQHAAPAADAAPPPSELMQGIYEHLFAHPYTQAPYLQLGPIPFHFTNHNLALLVSAGLVPLPVRRAPPRRRDGPRPRG